MLSNEIFADPDSSCKIGIKYLSKKEAQNDSNLRLELILGNSKINLEFDYFYWKHSSIEKALFDILNLPGKDKVKIENTLLEPIGKETSIIDKVGRILTLGTYKTNDDDINICLAAIDNQTEPNKTIKLCFPKSFPDKYLLFCLGIIQRGIIKNNL